MHRVNPQLTLPRHDGSMVKHYRITAIALPLLLYCVSGAIGSYFVWHATNGERGLKAKSEYKRQMAALGKDFLALQAERAQWSRRVELMRGEIIDRDILDEQARLVLDRLNRNDLVVFLPDAAQ